MKQTKDTSNHPAVWRKRFIWTLIFLLIAALSIWAVTQQAKDFSLRDFFEYLSQNDPVWLSCAGVSMLAYIFFDAWMIGCLLKDFSYRRSFPNCLSYAASDLYFSAITPSATGGQPMEAYFMFLDGVPGPISTAVVMAYLFFYTMSIVVIGFASLIFMPGVFMSFTPLGRAFIIVGAVIQTSLTVMYGLILWKKKMLYGICSWGLRVAAKLHFIRNLEEKQQKLSKAMDQYTEATKLLKGRNKLLVKTFLLNMAHRISQIMVTVFCFLAGGGAWQNAPKIFAIHSNVVIGACCIPIPGSMGITDFLMLDGFESLMSEQQAANLELISRTMSFYSCIFLCGMIVLIKYGMYKLKKKRQ